MTMNVQDETGLVTGANSYLSLADFETYHEDRGNSLGSATDDQKEQALIRATDYVDRRFSYVGRKLNGRLQVTQWPRVEAYDCDRQHISGIPAEVESATAEYALRALSGDSLAPDPTYDTTGAVVQSRREKVDVIEEQTTYSTGASAATFKMPRYPLADSILRRGCLVLSGGDLRRG